MRFIISMLGCFLAAHLMADFSSIDDDPVKDNIETIEEQDAIPDLPPEPMESSPLPPEQD